MIESRVGTITVQNLAAIEGPVKYRCGCGILRKILFFLINLGQRYSGFMMHRAVVVLALLLLCSSVCSVIDVKVVNKDTITNRQAGSLVSLVYDEYDPAATSANICVTVNGVDCYCSSFVKEFILSTKCVLDSPEISYWSALKVTADNGTVSIFDPIFVPILGNNKSWKTKCLINNNCIMSKPDDSLRVINHDGLTILLTLAMEDLSRSAVLFTSLYVNDYENSQIEEFIIVVPDKEYDDIADTLLPLLYTSLLRELSYNVIVVKESLLFHHDSYYQVRLGNAFTYAIQMAVKLLAAKIVQTKYYLVLDSDLILLRPLIVSELVVHGSHAIYHHESRSVHTDWWTQSEKFLNLTENVDYNSRLVKEQQGFGVTPALLHTFGASLVLSDINNRNNSAEAETHWLTCFGKDCVWSEYTLYRLVLDKYDLFHRFHIRDDSLPLYCNCIWEASDLPFDASAALSSNCLFSVVQSTSNIDVKELFRDYIVALSRRRSGGV